MRAFWVGLLVGAACGVGATLALSNRSDPADAIESASPDTENENAQPALTLLEPDVQPVDAQPSAPAGAVPATSAPQNEPDAGYQQALTAIRAQLGVLRDAKPGSDIVLQFIAEMRTRMKGTNEKDATLAGRALIRLARYGKLRPEETAQMAEDFAALPVGDRKRPVLAATVALGWSRDPKLDGWLRELPPTEEPDVRAAVVEALDESPSDAYRAYLLRLTMRERNPDVLDEAWNEDPIGVALTQDFAPKLIAAIEARITEGDLPVLVRARGIFAIGLAGVHDSPGAQAAIENLAATESDPGVRAFAQEALASVRRGEANVQSLEGIWYRHRRTFGTP